MDWMEQMRNGCAKCGATGVGMTMSMYNEDMICMACKAKEKKRPDYDQAVNRDLTEYAGRLDERGMTAQAANVRKAAAYRAAFVKE